MKTIFLMLVIIFIFACMAHAEDEGAFSLIIDDILFESNSSALSNQAISQLQRLAQGMAEMPEAWLHVEGHTDEKGNEIYNLNLGMRRARAVKDYLVSLGVAPARIEVGSKGKSEPPTRGHTEEAYRMNRCVTFAFYLD